MSTRVTSVWEPAHKLERSTRDVRKESIFEWFDKYVELINEATELLNIGKCLQMYIGAAEKMGLTHYELKTMSDTGFVAYWRGFLLSFEKYLQILIYVQNVKSETDSKVETEF